MNRYHFPLFGYVVWIVLLSLDAIPVAQAGCPCSNASFCDPIIYNNKEVYGLVLNSTPKEWATFNFSKLTTLIMIDSFDHNSTIEMMCLAHSYDVRVLTRGRS